MRKAFTMLELLCVVAMIAILAAISVPNFLEAQIRSKISRTRVDMATVAAALRAYCADHNAYPPNNPALREHLRNFLFLEIPETGPEAPLSGTYFTVGTEEEDDYDYLPLLPRLPQKNEQTPEEAEKKLLLLLSGWDLTPLTTPLPYFSLTLPPDPFRSNPYYRLSPRTPNPPRPFIYINTHDLALETTATLPLRYVLISEGPCNELSTLNPVRGPFTLYDATNGSTSKGDLVHF